MLFNTLSLGAGLLLTALSSQAITISLTRVGDNKDFGNGWGNAGGAPTQIVGSGNIDTVVAAAARYWENIILDTATVSFKYGWQHNSSTNNLGAASRGNSNSSAFIRFNNNYGSTWFADGSLLNTSDPHSEYDGTQQRFQDINLTTGGKINMQIGNRLRADDSASIADDRGDLFSVAIHEMGHALGLSSGNSSYTSQINSSGSDPLLGTYTIGSNYPLYENAILGVTGGHLNRDIYNADKTYGQPLMANASGRKGLRTLASEIDILAVASAGGYTNLDYTAATGPIVVPEPSSSLLLGCALTFCFFRRKR